MPTTKDNPTLAAIKHIRKVCNTNAASHLFWLRDIRLLVNSHSEAVERYQESARINQKLTDELAELRHRLAGLEK